MTNSDLRRTWRATFTRRWHTHPDLCHTVDPVGGHSERVALILLHFWPDASRDLIIAAMMHDLAESITGDMPPSAKEMFPTFDLMERHVAIAAGWHVDLSDTDQERLKFADKLDALMWAEHHRQADTSEWEVARVWLVRSAERMGVRDELWGAV
jgi:5'-deoxynucleotidase YfbR-like HD superfamily hydrolase